MNRLEIIQKVYGDVEWSSSSLLRITQCMELAQKPLYEKIDRQREVMRQALEALKNPDIVDSINRCLADEAIKSLEDTLE
jgi:hypothetical protein